jgi:hypothetical protein
VTKELKFSHPTLVTLFVSLETKDLFGWAMSVKKAAIGYEM